MKKNISAKGAMFFALAAMGFACADRNPEFTCPGQPRKNSIKDTFQLIFLRFLPGGWMNGEIEDKNGRPREFFQNIAELGAKTIPRKPEEIKKILAPAENVWYEMELDTANNVLRFARKIER
jgi:hypothetical protein